MPDKVIQELVRQHNEGRGQATACFAELQRIFAEKAAHVHEDDLLALTELAFSWSESESFGDVLSLKRDALLLLRRRDVLIASLSGPGAPGPGPMIESLARMPATDPGTATCRRVRLGWLLEQDLARWELDDLARLAQLAVVPEDSTQSALLVHWVRAELLRRGFRPPPVQNADVGVRYFFTCEAGRTFFEIGDERILVGDERIGPAAFAGFAIHQARSFSPLSCLCWGLWLALLPAFLPLIVVSALCRLCRREMMDWLPAALVLVASASLSSVLLPSGWAFRLGTLPVALLCLAVHCWKLGRDDAPWRWRPIPLFWVHTLRSEDGRALLWRTCDLREALSARRALERFQREARFPPAPLPRG